MRLVLDSCTIARRSADLASGDLSRLHIVAPFSPPIVRLGGRESPNFDILLPLSAEVEALHNTLLVTQSARLVWRGIELIAGVVDRALKTDQGLSISVVA
jgi:hypothetical protein